MNRLYETKDFIIPFENVPTASLDEKIGSVLDLTQSSHEPVYVLDESQKLVGIVSSYGSLYAKHYPFTTELSKLMVMPPRLSKDSLLYDVIDHMLSTRFYELPIFEDSEEIVGIIRAKDILEKFKEDEELLEELSQRIRIKKPETENINLKVGDVYHRLREKEVTRIVLVDDEGKLEGIVARRDIKEAFIRPTQRMRFSKKLGHNNSYSFDEEEFKREDKEIRSFYKKNVFTLPYNLYKREIIKKLIEADQNSVVLINEDIKPVGIISVRDILKAFSLLKPKEDSKIIIKKPGSNVSEKEFKNLYDLLDKFEKKISKRKPVDKVEIRFNKSKSLARSTIVFDTMLIFDFCNGDRLVAESKKYEFLTSAQEVISEIEKQLRRKSK